MDASGSKGSIYSLGSLVSGVSMPIRRTSSLPLMAGEMLMVSPSTTSVTVAVVSNLSRFSSCLGSDAAPALAFLAASGLGSGSGSGLGSGFASACSESFSGLVYDGVAVVLASTSSDFDFFAGSLEVDCS